MSALDRVAQVAVKAMCAAVAITVSVVLIGACAAFCVQFVRALVREVRGR